MWLGVSEILHLNPSLGLITTQFKTDKCGAPPSGLIIPTILMQRTAVTLTYTIILLIRPLTRVITVTGDAGAGHSWGILWRSSGGCGPVAGREGTYFEVVKNATESAAHKDIKVKIVVRQEIVEE